MTLLCPQNYKHNINRCCDKIFWFWNSPQPGNAFRSKDQDSYAFDVTKRILAIWIMNVDIEFGVPNAVDRNRLVRVDGTKTHIRQHNYQKFDPNCILGLNAVQLQILRCRFIFLFQWYINHLKFSKTLIPLISFWFTYHNIPENTNWYLFIQQHPTHIVKPYRIVIHTSNLNSHYFYVKLQQVQTCQNRQFF